MYYGGNLVLKSLEIKITQQIIIDVLPVFIKDEDFCSKAQSLDTPCPRYVAAQVKSFFTLTALHTTGPKVSVHDTS